MTTIPMTSFFGHQMVRAGDLWVSRTPFTNLDWQANVDRLRADHRRFGVLTERRVGNEVRYSLHYLSSIATLRDTFGHDRVGEDFGGSGALYNKDYTVAAFEFVFLERLGVDRLRHPVTDVTYFHAQAMCMAIGGDLMTDRQYISIVTGPKRYRHHATPNGQLSGPNGEEYVASSIKQERTQPVDVEDPAFPTDPETGTRHYTGNVWKWMRNNPRERLFGYRGGCFGCAGPRYFDAWYRGGVYLPDSIMNCFIGFLAAAPAQGS